MRYNLVLASAIGLVAADSIPQGTQHNPAWGNAIVQNNCGMTAYYIYDNQPTKNQIPSGGHMSVPLYTKVADGGGGSIKLFTDPNLDMWAPDHPAVTQFEFTPTDTNQFCDISNVNSNIGNGLNGNGQPCKYFPPFMAGGMQLSFPGSPDIICHPGQNPCKTAYSANNDDFATTASKIGDDITLTLCPNGAQGSVQSQPASPPASQPQAQAPSVSSATPPVQVEQHYAAPATTPAAQQPAAQPEEEVVWVTHTEFAEPAVATIVKDSNGNIISSPQKQKRQDHVHQHAHGKFNKRRHVA